MTGKLTMIGTMGIPVMTIKPETEIPLRHELKHRINLREDLVLSQRLKKLFAHPCFISCILLTCFPLV